MTRISISSFEPSIVIIDLSAFGRPLRVQVARQVLEHALQISNGVTDLHTAVEQHIEAIRDVAWAKHDNTHELNIVLNSADLEPLLAWAKRTGPPVLQQVPEKGPA
ncbi:hypothetical protein [Variovorax sp. HJSM1_2]|uniref:hypothetical protein n=1 Tax=Variovorax sp. HJSM1_2 TaxID=3366263 RepID=UPI003BC0CF64